MLRSAIIGCGAISKTHAEAITKSGSLVALCDIVEQRASEMSEKYGGAVYTDYEAMLENEDIDVVHICLPHYLHVKAAIYALEKGMSVVLEKPPAMNESEFLKLKNAAKGKKLCVCFQNRFNESTRLALDFIKSGEYGSLIGCRGIVTWNREGGYYSDSLWRGKKKYEGGGVLINQALHTLDLLNVFSGEPVGIKSVCHNLTHPDIDVEDNVVAVIDYKGDRRAVFYATTSSAASPSAEIMLMFENGTVTVDSNTILFKRNKGEKKFVDLSVDGGVGKSVWGSSHTRLISSFYSYVQGDGDNPCSLESCENTMKLLNIIYKE